MKKIVVLLATLSVSSVALAEPETVIVGNPPTPSVTVLMTRSRPSADMTELRQSFTYEIVRDAASTH